jgi:integrase/recombinase XerD
MFPCIQNLFLEFSTEKDKELVADFITACVKQENIALGTRRAYLVALARLASHNKGKTLDSVTSKDLASYLNKMQRERDVDPDQSWINTQRAYGVPLVKFYKWLAYPDWTPDQRKHMDRDKYPPILQGVVLQTKKGSRSPIKAKDIWNDQDVAIFLKYCKDNPRLRFYHALAYETSGRPGELLQLKIGDKNVESDAEGKLYAALDIGREGKRKQSRIVGITDFSIQYYQDYLAKTHPDPTNKEAYIFISRERSAYARNIAISGDTLRADYFAFRDKVIPRLLKERSDISDQDKKHLQMLKDQKKWNPYTLRHSSITTLARHSKINDYVLRQHAGWSKRSDMVEIYTHELKGDSLEYVLEARGINIRSKRDERAQLLRDEQVGPYCPYCKTVNVPNTQFCSSCSRPITTISYDSAAKDAEKTRKEMDEMKAKMTILEANTSNLLKLFVTQGNFIDVEDKETGELVLYTYNEKEGPIETAKAIREAKKKEEGIRLRLVDRHL